jgi:NAD-dependent SIR2 family protein deacetylase
MNELLDLAAEWVAPARALLVAAGAGMGVDSGLPDFRGNEGFWNAYPAYARLGLRFEELANPHWFERDPALAWGFYGHRLNLYRETKPHEGFDILRRHAERMPLGAFVYTSNVDGHFQAAGFAEDRVCEVHGSVHWMQWLRGCGVGLFPAERAAPGPLTIEPETFRAREPLPKCPSCGSLARPNILMFSDGGWDPDRSYDQEFRLGQWVRTTGLDGLVIVECGAGTAIPTVRRFSESMASRGGRLIRVNVREPAVPAGHVGLAMGALEALREIDRRLAAA